MKKIVLVILLVGSIMSCTQNEPAFYKKKTLKSWLEDYKKNKNDKKAKQAILDYHRVPKAEFMALTHDFWNSNQKMDFLKLTKTDVVAIAAYNDSADPTQKFEFVKFDPSTDINADDIKVTKVHTFEPTKSCYLVDLFDILSITMKSDDMILLTKGYDYIMEVSPAGSLKPFSFKRYIVVPFMRVDKDGKIKAYYDISHDPELTDDL